MAGLRHKMLTLSHIRLSKIELGIRLLGWPKRYTCGSAHASGRC